MVLRVVERLSTCFERPPTLIAPEREGYAALGLRRIEDRYPGRGPLAGLDAALADATRAGAGAAVLVGCDMPWLNAELLAEQCQRLESHVSGDACVPHLEGRWEGLHGVYATALGERAQERVKAHKLRFQEALESWEVVDAVQGSAYAEALWHESVRSQNSR